MAPTATRIVLVLLLAAAMLACWPWLFAPESRPADAPPAPTSSGDAVSATIDRAADVAATETPAAVPVEREAAPTKSTDTTGSLLVHVVWGDDKQPAVGIDVHVYRSGVDSLFDTPRGLSDATGSVLFEGLAPGNVYPSIDRADHGGGEKAVIVAGARTELTLEVKMGMNAKGRVVDDQGTAVGDAEVVVAGWGGGKTQTLAHSAADGTFVLRAVATHCHIGARKAGFVPSSLRQFTASDGTTVDFTIVLTRGGTSLEGVVLDPQGQPVADAVVRAGATEQNNHKLPDGANAMGPQCEQLRTDAAGRFVFASVVPGKVPVAARAKGLSPWHEDVEVLAGRTGTLTIRLLPGVTLFGTVRDAAGAPRAKVEIGAGDYEYLGRRDVRSAADGTFLIDGLATGTLKAYASDDKLGRVAASFDVVAGEKRRWDPVLSSGLQMRGRVVDVDDAPVKGVMIEAMVEQPTRGEHWSSFENTDAEGRFVLNNCTEGRSLRISVRRKSTFPEAVLTGIMPSAEELVIRLPKEAWVHIQGTVLGPDGEVVPNVHISPYMKNGNGSPAETADGKTGSFRYGPYPPGTYSMRLSAAGFPTIRLAERALGPDAVWDVGTLHFRRGGTLVVQLIGSDASLPKLSVTVYDLTGAYVDRVETKDGIGRAGPLQAGAYTLQVAGESIASVSEPFIVRVDGETRLDVPLRRGIAATIECTLPEGSMPTGGVTVALVVRDEKGEPAWRGSAWARPGQAFTPTVSKSPTAQLALAPGDYTIEATCDDLRANGTITVTSAGPARTTLELRRP